MAKDKPSGKTAARTGSRKKIKVARGEPGVIKPAKAAPDEPETEKEAPREKKRRSNISVGFNVITVSAAVLLSIVLTLIVNFGIRETVSAGSVAQRRYQAPREIINEAATQTRRDQAASRARANTIWKTDSDVTESVMKTLDEFFTAVSAMRMEYRPLINPTAGQTGGESQNFDLSTVDMSSLSLDISTVYLSFLIESSGEVYGNFMNVVYSLTERMLASGIKEDSLFRDYITVRDELALIDEWDNLVKNAGYTIISQILKPNTVIDSEAMDKAATEAAEAVEPVIVAKGQNIVNQGEVITQDAYDLLAALGLISAGISNNIIPMLGAVLSILAVFAAVVPYLALAYRKKLADKKNVMLLFTLFSASLLITWPLTGASFVLAPIVLFTMLAAILVDSGLAVIFNISLTIVTSVIFSGDVKFLVYFITCGLFISIISKRLTERNKMLSVMSQLIVFSAVSVFAAYLLQYGALSREMTDTIAISVLYGAVTVIVCVGSLQFFESIFGFVTPIKLIDLSNPNNPLLRRLIIEAPGTYHHCLIVANLAETAAYDIGANPTLARVGGYYHDIGKLNYPRYYIENVTDGDNPHDKLDPYKSVELIKAHVDYGLELADEYKLPAAVRAFIAEHHGESTQTYFYNKICSEKPGEDIDETPFRYGYQRPQSPETAVVMLADSCEAAVRSMIPKGKTMDEVEEFVQSLIKSALDKGRLRDSGFTIKDLDTIRLAFMRVFRGMYHERIEYPGAPEPRKIVGAKAAKAKEAQK